MSSVKKKVIISACLLGEPCRYDGKSKEVNAVTDAYKDYEIIPFCPEAPIFGTPREKINVVEVDEKCRVITNETNLDVTQKLKDEVASFIKKHPKIDDIVLKSKSPSCGYGTTPILNDKKEQIKLGNGVASQMLQKHFKSIKLKDELVF